MREKDYFTPVRGGKDKVTINNGGIPEFSNEKGFVLCGEDISEYHKSVADELKGRTVEEYLTEIIHEYGERNFIDTKDWIVQDGIASSYDKCIAQCHLGELESYVTQYSNKLVNEDGKYKWLELAEVYYAAASGISERDVEEMVKDAHSYENMRVIRRGYENGLNHYIVKLYSDIKDPENQMSLLSGIMQGMPTKYIIRARDCNSPITIMSYFRGVNKGLGEEDLEKILMHDINAKARKDDKNLQNKEDLAFYRSLEELMKPMVEAKEVGMVKARPSRNM